MMEHVHRCLSCTPDMVPDFDRDDPRYHDGRKCGHAVYALIDGVDPGYTNGMFEGAEGWALCVGATLDDVHACPCERGVCTTLRFGNVEARHRCPARRPAS